jgi:hypothetical protein
MKGHTTKALTHVPTPEAAANGSTIDQQELINGAEAMKSAVASGKEQLLGFSRSVLHDGSVIDAFHHKAHPDHPPAG